MQTPAHPVYWDWGRWERVIRLQKLLGWRILDLCKVRKVKGLAVVLLWLGHLERWWMDRWRC